MKLNGFVLGAGLCLSLGLASAQTGASTGTTFGSGQDSIRCRQNLSLFSSYAKSGAFQDAYEPWRLAYEECPASSKNIYIYGVRILRWKIEQEKDATKRKELVGELLKLYDTRIKYFGDDVKYGEDVIIANKIGDYIQLYGAEVDYQQILDWARPVMEKYGENSNPQLLYYLAYASRAIALVDRENKSEQYINDYLTIAEYLDKQIAAAGEDEASASKIAEFKAPLETDFAQSGLADCDLLKKVYTTDKVEAGKGDKNFLKSVVLLFEVASCEAGNPAYQIATRALFDLEPSAMAAKSLAKAAMESKNYKEAIEFLNKALELSKDGKDRSQTHEVLAQLYMTQGNVGSARQHANQALSDNPRSGSSLLILAQLIGRQASNLFPDDKVKQRCVYYLVIDKLNHAASVDPSVAAHANRLIASYRGSLPSQADIFMHPELKQGASFSVPGYGTTTIR